MEHKRKWFTAGRMRQAAFVCGKDVESLAGLDRKQWLAISMPVDGVRFDARMLKLMDSDGDGRIRTPEVLAAVEFLKLRGVDFDSLFTAGDAEREALAEVLAKQADLAKVPPSEDDRRALEEWERKGESAEVAVLGADTAAAESALSAVEAVIEDFFTPPADMPLVTEEPDRTLPLSAHLNPRHAEAVIDFAARCVKPLIGECETLDRFGWKKVKAAFAPYRGWKSSRPVMNAGVLGELENEERELRYRLHLVEFLENFVNMRHLYDENETAIFQNGTLRIDAREMNLCFHVESEAAHAALAAKSKCCVIYLKLSRPSEKAGRQICAVVTAGTVGQLYAGRNGVFYDRDGKDWEAVITRVVESQVSLAEAFWAPWKKLGECVGDMVKKFLGDRQSAATTKVAAGARDAQAGGAAIAGSVAAIGIGVGVMGAAFASIASAVSGMSAGQIALSLVALIMLVSMPSVILTWFKLRQRDIGAILNASGWAINRPMRFSMRRAHAFTVCPPCPARRIILWTAVIALWAVAAWMWLG